MSLPLPSAPRRTSNRSTIWLGCWIIVLLVTSITFFIFWYTHQPNSDRVSPYPKGIEIPIAYNGEWLPGSARMRDGSLYLPLKAINMWVDPDFIWDKASETIIVTTQNQVLRMQTDRLTAYVNQKPIALRMAPLVQGEEVYLPADILTKWGLLKISLLNQGHMILVEKPGDILIWGRVVPSDKPFPIRQGPNPSYPIVGEVSPNEKLKIFSEENESFRIQTLTGDIGYLPKNQITLESTESLPLPKRQRPYLTLRPNGQTIHLTWEYVHEKTASPQSIGSLDGINVVSPTWFELVDNQGNIKSKADANYVKWAHSQGIQVWALFNNGFNPEWTHSVLKDTSLREKMTKQLLAYAELYDLDGINLDIENVHLDDKEALVQWVRELVPLLHEQDLTVSMDITTFSFSENWSLFYDRKQLGELVDYIALMAYDENWASSPTSGSVASLPWVERGIVQLIESGQVDASKILLGIPYYTRLWTEETINGKVTVSSKALSMDKAEALLKQKGLNKTYSTVAGQNVAEWSEAGKTYKIWFEDETSLSGRVALMKKYRLAGIATWRRGFERDGILPWMDKQIKKRP